MKSHKYLMKLFGICRDPSFFYLTILGNAFIFIISVVFYQIEFKTNAQITNYLDSLWWAFTTVTTVGYGDIVPITSLGKIIGIVSMLVGTALFATYTALFANILLGRDMGKMRQGLTKTDKHLHEDIIKLKEDIQDLKKILKDRL